MLNIEIHIPSKDSDFLLNQSKNYNESISALKNGNKADVSVIIHENNRKSLCSLYNEILNDIRNSGRKVDYLFLMHSDVILDIDLTVRRLINLGDKYDLIGFAGTKKIDFKISPLTWFTASINVPNERYGKIVQFVNGQTIESFFNEHSPNVKDTAVGAIDGLCMILNEKILKSDIKFDDNLFENDFYDLDFCMTCISKYKFKIGVLTDPVFHSSLGTAVLTNAFREKEVLFRRKWDLSPIS